jgi:hypothetical protein
MANIDTVITDAYNYITSKPLKWMNAINYFTTTFNSLMVNDNVTYYIDKINGSDSDTCVGSEDHPFKTISKAIQRSKKARTINLIMKNHYLVTENEDFQNHTNVSIDLNRFQLQFKKRILPDITDPMALNGAGTGMYNFRNISGLNILCTGSAIVIPACNIWEVGETYEICNACSAFLFSNPIIEQPQDVAKLNFLAQAILPEDACLFCIIGSKGFPDRNFYTNLVNRDPAFLAYQWISEESFTPSKNILVYTAGCYLKVIDYYTVSIDSYLSFENFISNLVDLYSTDPPGGYADYYELPETIDLESIAEFNT